MHAKRVIYLFTFFTLPLSAQTDSLLLRNYQSVKQQDAWLTSPNAAALTRFTAPNIALAEASLTKGKGGLTDYYESPNTLEADVAAESFYRLGARTVVFGSISYNNYTGEDMTGSAFINPTRKPFSITEDSLTNAGRKHRDTYHLAGAVGVDVWRGYAVGLRLDYTAANYAKYKDLRHKNKLMDLTVSASAYAPVLPWLSVGADYRYHRQTESLQFSTYGKNDKVYKSLLDYGAFLGRVEQFGNEGFTDKSREMPLFEDSHGGGVQIGLRPLPQLTALATAALVHGEGYYGRRSPYTITYTQHDRDQTMLTLALTYQPLSRTSKVRLDLSYADEKLQNRAETFRELTNESGANYYEYYDPTETADKHWYDFAMAATADLGIHGQQPTWQFQAAYQRAERDQKAYLYPFYRTQHLTTHEVSASATRHLLWRRGILSVSLNGAFRQGHGAPYRDFAFVEPSERQESPAVMEAFLYREYQYLTAPQYTLGGSVQYAFLLPGTRLKTHARLQLVHRHANNSNEYSTGSNRTQATLTLGCTF